MSPWLSVYGVDPINRGERFDSLQSVDGLVNTHCNWLEKGSEKVCILPLPPGQGKGNQISLSHLHRFSPHFYLSCKHTHFRIEKKSSQHILHWRCILPPTNPFSFFVNPFFSLFSLSPKKKVSVFSFPPLFYYIRVFILNNDVPLDFDFLFRRR